MQSLSFCIVLLGAVLGLYSPGHGASATAWKDFLLTRGGADTNGAQSKHPFAFAPTAHNVMTRLSGGSMRRPRSSITASAIVGGKGKKEDKSLAPLSAMRNLFGRGVDCFQSLPVPAGFISQAGITMASIYGMKKGIKLMRGTLSDEMDPWTGEPIRRPRRSRKWLPELGMSLDGGAEKAPKKKVLILMSDTGGGHKASALALKAALDDLYPGRTECNIVDIWTDYARWPFNTFVQSYQFLASKPSLWKAFWDYGRFPLTRFGSEELSNLMCQSNFRKCLEDYDPDLVISVHPLCQDVPLRALKKMGRRDGQNKLPFVTVVTDLGGAHPTWFSPNVDKCFVPSDAVREIAEKCKLSDDQIVQHGLPLRQGFWSDLGEGKADLRRSLGLDEKLNTALVVGGGDGVGRLGIIAGAVIKELGKKNEPSQVVVVCGKNDKVRNNLLTKTWPDNVKVVVNGFVTNMDAWMAASDCIVTKAGPGTIAEASVRGLPVMLSGFLPGQEAGNVPYVVEGGFGAHSKDPKKIAGTVAQWFGNPDQLQELSSNARKAARQQATLDIARDIGELLFPKKN